MGASPACGEGTIIQASSRARVAFTSAGSRGGCPKEFRSRLSAAICPSLS